MKFKDIGSESTLYGSPAHKPAEVEIVYPKICVSLKDFPDFAKKAIDTDFAVTALLRMRGLPPHSGSKEDRVELDVVALAFSEDDGQVDEHSGLRKMGYRPATSRV
jgi:hypothetical protein